MKEQHSRGNYKGVVGDLAKIAQIVEQTYHFEQTGYRIKRDLEKNKMLINKHLGMKRSLSVKPDAETEFLVSKNTDIKIEFFADKLKEKLSPGQFQQIADKKVVVPDYAKLVQFLKGFGVPPKEFKSFIEVECSIDNDKLDHLVETGEIAIEEIEGCYKADFED